MWRLRPTGLSLLDTETMASCFERLDHLQEGQLLALRASWRSIDRESHEAAWADVRAVGTRDGLTKEIDRVRKRALGWVSRGSNTIPYRLNNDDTWLQIKIEAGEAIVDAALALALGSRLGDASIDTLLAPWRRANEAMD